MLIRRTIRGPATVSFQIAVRTVLPSHSISRGPPTLSESSSISRTHVTGDACRTPPVRRDHWQRRIAELDPDADFAEIYRIMAAHEFPWDVTQALGLALFRTYAVPSIGELLAATGEFENRVHKRYADTGLILEAVLEHGFASTTGRSAIRRMNQMHGSYAISNDDMRYVQSTFVVIPLRWLDRYGWRRPSEAERRASANYYRELGRHMNIKDSPRTYAEFASYLDAYEREHFAFSPGGRRVADSTL